MKKAWMAVALTLLATNVFASNLSLDGFNKRFKLLKNDDGSVRAVQMKLFTKKFRVAPYLKLIKDDLIEEIERMRNANLVGDGAYEAELDAFIAELEEAGLNSVQGSQNALVIRDSLENLPAIAVEKSFIEVGKFGVLENFEKKFSDLLLNFNLAVIANPNDARFFYKKNVTYLVVTKALEFAKKRLGNIPVLNLASFVIVKVHDLVLEQRTFHQNMLLHYLENFSHEELGLTKKQADHVFSSIYESRISAMNYFESNNAVNTWGRYGTNKFFQAVRSGNNRIRRGTYVYDSVGPKYNFGFLEVVEKGERVVKDLTNNKHMLSGQMATAYNYAKPNKVKRFRSLLGLGQIGLGFLPIPGWLKAQADSFIDSYYVKQKRSEGALVAYFESNGNMKMFQAIMKQNKNPYLIY